MIGLTLLTLLLTLLQFASGFAVIAYLYPVKKIWQRITLSIMLGMAISTLGIMLLELVHIPINLGTFIAIQVLITGALHFKFDTVKGAYKTSFTRKAFSSFKLYEIAIFVPMVYLLFISVWRCVYLPLSTFDSMVGIDLVAQYTVREGTVANSVFTYQLPHAWFWSNQPFYAPFVTFSQVIWRLLGFPFGKIWLAILTLNFAVFFYSKVAEYAHPIFAALAVLMLTMVPEMYAYTFLIQTDYTSMVYMFLGVVFFYEYINQKEKGLLYLSIVFMAIAVWVRSETIFFLPFGSLWLLLERYRSEKKLGWRNAILFSALPAIGFILWNFIYIKSYLPIAPDTFSKLNLDFSHYYADIKEIMYQMNRQVIFADKMIGNDYWGYMVYIFEYGLLIQVAYAIASVYLFKKPVNDQYKGLSLLFWLLVMYVVFIILIQHIPSANVAFTFRRGFFKFFPIMIFYLMQSPLVGLISGKIQQWETGKIG